MKLLQISSFIVCILVASILPSCNYSGTETVAFCVDEAAYDEQPQDGSATMWTVNYTDGSSFGELRASPGKTFSLTMPRNCCIPLLARAENAAPTVKPYGAIYPYTTTLTKADGFSADILRTLYSASSSSNQHSKVQTFLSRFNWQRFMETCRTYEDPWLLDRERILTKIANGTFTMVDFKYQTVEK